MHPFVYFLLAAALIGVALFGSDIVRGFIAQPGNVVLLQLFIGALGTLLGIVGLFLNRKKQQQQNNAQSLTIEGGVHQSGNHSVQNIANKHNSQKNPGT